MSTATTCRFCGAEGLEDDDDVAPGVCPTCLDQRMGAALRVFEQNDAYDLTDACRLIREAGVSEAAAQEFVAIVWQGVKERFA